MNVTLLSGLCIKIVIDYSSISVLLIYLRMFACIHVVLYVIVITCACQCDLINKLDDVDGMMMQWNLFLGLIHYQKVSQME